MATHALLLLGVFSCTVTSSSESERGRMELRRVRSLAAEPRFGPCWARALRHLDTRCTDMTSESQSRVALQFTRCHLSSSGRDFPSCPEGSEVSRCTAGMDSVAFNTFTEFFTHTYAICHFLQSDAWQSRAESAMYRLTESSAGVAEQLESMHQMAVELTTAQRAALQAQQEILANSEDLRVTLIDSTQGLRSLFLELSSVSREQQVALSELFNRVSFLQSFLLMEAHSLSSCCYNAAALCAAFLLTATRRSSRARLVLLCLVCLNFYLEKKIYQYLISDHPEHQHMELLAAYVSMLRRFMACVGGCVLLAVCVRYRDPMQQSLQVLQQLAVAQKSLQEVLQRAEHLGAGLHVKMREQEVTEETRAACHRPPTAPTTTFQQRSGSRSDKMEKRHNEEEECRSSSHGSVGRRRLNSKDTFFNASVQSPHWRAHRSPSPPLVYSVLVDNKQPHYSLRTSKHLRR